MQATKAQRNGYWYILFRPGKHELTLRQHLLLTTDLADHIELGNLVFEWVQSYDTKDWERLKQCLAPSTRLDYRSVQGELLENLTPAEFANNVQGFIQEKRLMTQHLIGASRWEYPSKEAAKGWHQLRVAHQRYADDELTTVVNKGHGYGFVEHSYLKVDGKWKIEGCKPILAWSEYDLFGTLNPEI